MSGVRRNAGFRSSKPPKHPKDNDGCSRVGSNYQVDVPDFIYVHSSSFKNEPSHLEVNVWNPDHSPSVQDMNAYLSEAIKFKYSQESARTLLHYHKYNIRRAVDDLPNYQPILNTWNKHDVRRFLKCVDGRPRKNFVNVKRSFPAYRMGEVHGLYYGIAAPFKAISRHNRRHGRQMQNCYEKALKCGFIPTPSSPQRQVVAPVLEDEEASVDSALERHLCDIVGWQQAGRLLADVRRGRPTASSSIINEGGGYRTLTFGRRFPGAATESLAASSDHSSSFCDSRPRMNKRGLPSGMHYDHEEFLKFVKTPPEELEKMREDELSKLAPVDNELKSLIKSVDAQIQGIFEGLEKFYPEGGFPNVSYRWTRLELALFVSALSKHGDDFAAIAQTLGTKSESFLRDFYNQYRSRFDLDTFIGKEQVSPDDEVKLHPESRILLPSPVSEPTVVKCLPVTTASLPSPLQSPPPEIKPEDDSKASLVNGEPESTFKLPIALSEPSTASPTPVKQSTKAASRSRRHSASKQEEAETQHSCSSSSTSRQQASGSQTPNVEHCPETPFKNSRSRRSAISLSSEEIGDNRPIQAPRSSTSQNQKVDAEPQRKMKKDEDEGAVKPQRVRLPKKLAIDAISRRPKRGQSSEASTPNKRRRSQNKIDPDSHLSSFKRGRSSKSPHQPTSLRRSRSQKSLTDVGVDKKNQSRPEKQNHEKTVLPGPALKSKGRQTGVSPALSQRRRRPSTTAAEPPKKRTRASTTLALSRSSNRRR